jgi:Caspase domain
MGMASSSRGCIIDAVTNWHPCQLLLALSLCFVAADATARQQPARDLVFNKGERKVALVIGNDSYPQARLQNARNDARAVAAALKELGFVVTTVEDANRDQLESAVAKFGDALQPTDVAWFFYAGHGLQVGGENYLIPTDFTGTSQTSVRLSALPVTELQTAFSRAQVSVVVLDACRNNPFLATRSGGGGLAPIEARGSLVSFSTGAGQTASDNLGAKNGLFTQELLAVIREPGVTVRDMFFRVRQRVFEASSGEQFPAVYDGLVGNFVLRPAPATPAPTTTEATQKPALPPARPAPAAPTGAAKGGGAGKWVLIGGGVAGAAGAAVALGGGGGGQEGSTPTTTTTTPTTTTPTATTTPAVSVKRGDYSGTGTITYQTNFSDGRVGSCTHVRTLTGTLSVAVEPRADGTLTGSASTTTILTHVSASSGCSTDGTPVGTVVLRESWSLTMTGTTQNLAFTSQTPFTSTPSGGGSVSGTRTLSFQGTFDGGTGTIAGTLRLVETADGTTLGAPLTWRGSATADVTLR